MMLFFFNTEPSSTNRYQPAAAAEELLYKQESNLGLCEAAAEADARRLRMRTVAVISLRLAPLFFLLRFLSVQKFRFASV